MKKVIRLTDILSNKPKVENKKPIELTRYIDVLSEEIVPASLSAKHFDEIIYLGKDNNVPIFMGKRDEDCKLYIGKLNDGVY